MASSPDPPEPVHALRVIQPKISYSILPTDDFVGYPVPLTNESRRLFTIREWPHRALRGESVFLLTCQLGTPVSHHDCTYHGSLSEGLVRAWSQPLMLRCCLLVMAGQLFWGTGSLQGLERALIENKVEVIREVNQRLAAQSREVDDLTVSAVMSLALVEVS